MEYMTSAEYNVQKICDSKHKYKQSIIKVIFKLSMPFIVYGLMATSITIMVR